MMRRSKLIWLVGISALSSGTVHAQSSPSVYTSGYRYDDAGRLTGTILPDPDGNGPIHFGAVRNTYDIAGRLVTIERGELASWQSDGVLPKDWAGFTVFSTTSMTYDGLNNKIAESVVSGATTYALTQYAYDGDGRLMCTAVRMNPAAFATVTNACVLGPQGSADPDRITQNFYNGANFITKIQKSVGTPLQQDYATYTYTATLNQASIRDANSNVTTYTYDGFDRLVATAFPSKTVTGNSASCTIGTIAEAADGFGSMVAGPSETRAAGDDCEKYAYDRNGNRAKLMKRDGNVIRYAFDALNRNTIKDIPGGTLNDVYFGYDLRGLQTFARFVSTSGAGITNVYDGFGQLQSTTNDMGATARTLGYTYDADGNRSQLTYPDSSFFTYIYDGLDRLTTIKEAGATAIVSTLYNPQQTVASQTRGAVTTTLGYDPVSRPTSWTDDLAGTTSDVTSTFAYNPASQMVTKTRSNDAYAFNAYVSVSRPYAVNGLNQYATAGSATFTYDANGNLTGDGTNSYGYDVENRMISATTAIGAITLKYDPLGRLWQYSFPARTWEYTYDGDAMVMAVYPNATLKFVHGPNEDDPMIQYTGSARLSLQADYQGSIVSMADTTGTKTTINTYDEYGISPSTNGGFFQYTGQVWLGQLGLYYYKARMYSPTLGRFMQTDPIGYKDQNNLYAYVGNDPINGRDPTGQETCIGTRENCAIVYAGGDKFRETAAKSPEGSELREKAANFGPRGSGTVVIADPTYTGEAKFDSEKGPHGKGAIIVGALALGEGADLLGGTLSHEQTHQDDFVRDGPLKTGNDRMATERHAYTVGNIYRQVQRWEAMDVESHAKQSFSAACKGRENEPSCK